MATIHLIKDGVYRGRIEAFASSVWGKDYIGGKVKEGLEGIGFTDLTVWMHENELPADWLPEARADISASGHTQAWVHGTWSKDTGDYPDHGEKWQVLDYWPVSLPQDAGCATEGYSCDPNAPAYADQCCPGLKCASDDANKFGGGNRCQFGGPTTANPPKPGTSVVKYVVGGLVVLAAGWATWTYGLPAMGMREKKNPTGNQWEIRVNDRRVQWSWQTYKRLFGEGKTSIVIEADTADEAFKIFSDSQRGLNPWYFEVKPVTKKNPHHADSPPRSYWNKIVASGSDRSKEHVESEYTNEFMWHPRRVYFQNGTWFAETNELDLAGNPYRYRVQVNKEGDGLFFASV